MKNLSIFCFAILATGCTTTVPVTMKFPEAPKTLLEPCEKLETIDESNYNNKTFAETLVKNNIKYHECKAKDDALIEWIKKQKEIFERVDK